MYLCTRYYIVTVGALPLMVRLLDLVQRSIVIAVDVKKRNYY